MTDADVDMAELTQAAAAAAAGENNLEGADDPSSTERPPSRREDLLQNAYFDVERGTCGWVCVGNWGLGFGWDGWLWTDAGFFGITFYTGVKLVSEGIVCVYVRCVPSSHL